PGFIRELREIVLAPPNAPITATVPSDAGSVDGKNVDGSALRIFDGGIYIRVAGPAAPKAIYTVADHDDLMASSVRRPALDEIAQRKVRAGVGARNALRKEQGFGRLRVVLGKILDNLRGAVLHVSDADAGGRGL